MAASSTGDQLIGLAKGSTWGTSPALMGATGIRGRYTLTANREEWRSSDVGMGLFVADLKKLGVSVSIQLTFDVFFGHHGTMLMAMVLGSDTASETTSSQGDYAHAMNLTSANTGLFTNFVASYGPASGNVLEIPSVKWHDMTLSMPVNGVMQATFTGMGDRIVTTSTVNDRDDLAALTFQDFSDTDDRYAAYGECDDYFRINATGGSGLTSGDEKEILSAELTLSRPLVPLRTLDGCNSRYTKEPAQTDPTTGTLTVQFGEINSSEIDLLGLWSSFTKQKAELYLAGSQIGTGVDRSFKFQLPKLEAAGDFPAGFDLPNNNTLMQPTVTFNLLKAASAPTGMTGIVNYLRATAVNGRATGYLA